MTSINQRYGSLKLLSHPEKIKSFLEDKVTPPIYIRIKPTNRCNHRCEFCSYDPVTGDLSVRNELNRTDEIPIEKMREILENLKEMKVKAVTYSGGGEPLVYPNIEETMQRTLDYGIDLSIITNGQSLSRKKAEILSKANWVRISSDASDAKSFSKIRRVPEDDFYKLTSNIENFAKIKDALCELGINFVVHKNNSDQVYRSVGHFKNLGANHIKITPRWISNFEEYHKPIIESVLEQIAKARQDFQDKTFNVHDTYEGDFSGASVSERSYNRCYVMQTIPVIAANCKVYFCHDKAYASDGILGSIKDKSFKELWFSKEATEIFKKFNPKEKCNHHCANDSKNKLSNGLVGRESEYSLILAALDCYGRDVNFI
jgi:MoaA/NifB/PqqE/SkfB family radical SAM enzyme